MSRNKAQVFSLDFVIALMLFIVILIVSEWAWSTSVEKIYFTEGRNDLEILARNAASLLVQNVGDPPNWQNLSDFNTTNISALGFAKNRPWFIDEGKVSRLTSLNNTNYSEYKKLLGIRGPGYEFHLNVSKFNKTAFNDLAIIGESPNASAESVVKIDRIVLSGDDKNWTKITMKVWKKCVGAACY